MTERKSRWDSAVAVTEDPLSCLYLITISLSYLALTEVHWLPWVFTLTMVFLARRYTLDNRAAKANR